MKYVFAVIGVIIFVIALSLALDYGLGVKWYGFIAPKKKAVEREVFLNTRSYKEAQKQNLIKYMHEWRMADEDGKLAVESTVRHIYAEYDENELPLELRKFLKKVKYGE